MSRRPTGTEDLLRGSRRRSSARWCAATATSTPARTPCRRRCWRPRCSGRRRGGPTTPRRGCDGGVASARPTSCAATPPAAGGRRPTPSARRPRAGDADVIRARPTTTRSRCCSCAATRRSRRPSQLALTLRAVGGLTTAEIARRLPRARGDDGAAHQPGEADASRRPAPRFDLPPPASERAERLGVVLHVLYLVFNEGYTATSGASWCGPS